jgi:hypothetical protein
LWNGILLCLSLLTSHKENDLNDAGYASAKTAAADLHDEALVSQPKPARSAFMCFSDAKQKEFMTDGYTKKELIQRVAEAWRDLSPKVRRVTPLKQLSLSLVDF